ncbi:MAG: hypothetical protein CM15mP13_2340 [Pseudomonadota bacterium]|nr:MAG: hypothetical protein CM15mP13_2340 [Pseudomonadota bacterium]
MDGTNQMIYGKEIRNLKIEEKWDKFNDKDYLDFSIQWISEIKRLVKEKGKIL